MTGDEATVDFINGAREMDAAVSCEWSPTKGRILQSQCAQEAGTVILSASPLIEVSEPSAGSSQAYNLLREMCDENPEIFPLDPMWYWLVLASLTPVQLGNATERVHGLPPPTTEDIQQKLLLLYAGVDKCGVNEILDRCVLMLAEALGLCKIDPHRVKRLLAVWMFNCFEHTESPKGYALYFVPSFMSHSCAPSAVWMLDGEGRYVLRARCDLSAGDEVTISYLSEDMLLETATQRQSFLLSSKGFWCSCERCYPETIDKSRGFCCPVRSCAGIVFGLVAPKAQSDPAGKRRRKSRKSRPGTELPQGRALASSAFAPCSSCGRTLSDDDVANFVRDEIWLRKQVQGWEDESPRGRLTHLEVENLFARISDRFAQHSDACQAYGHLVATCLGLGSRDLAEQLALKRLTFQGAVFDGLSCARTWTLEVLAGIRLTTVGCDIDGLLRKPQRHQSLMPLLNGTLSKRVEEHVLPLYREALAVHVVMFGAEHEYSTVISDKLVAVETALRSVSHEFAT